MLILLAALLPLHSSSMTAANFLCFVSFVPTPIAASATSVPPFQRHYVEDLHCR